MSAPMEERLGARLLETLELVEFGLELTRHRLEREHPEASHGEIDRLFEDWLRDRPADGPQRLVEAAPTTR